MVGSKFEGTRFEKLQMVQTHVAALGGGVSAGGGLNGLSERWRGEAAPDRDGTDPSAGDRPWSEDLFVGFGIRVTFADDFRNPACGRGINTAFRA